MTISYELTLNVLIIMGGIAFLVAAKSIKLTKRKIIIKEGTFAWTAANRSPVANMYSSDKIKEILISDGIKIASLSGMRSASNKAGIFYHDNIRDMVPSISKHTPKRIRVFYKNSDLQSRLLASRSVASGLLLAYSLDGRLELIA